MARKPVFPSRATHLLSRLAAPGQIRSQFANGFRLDVKPFANERGIHQAVYEEDAARPAMELHFPFARRGAGLDLPYLPDFVENL